MPSRPIAASAYPHTSSPDAASPASASPRPPNLEAHPRQGRRPGRVLASILAAVVGGSGFCLPTQALENVYLTDVPDYEWHAGCLGTTLGNLVGYWDRHGFPEFYTGPTADGEAPLLSFRDNRGIFALWASQAGVDGRPDNRPGHYDDYYVDYEYVGPDPYVSAGRPEHFPDCIGDFIGLNQRKWNDLGGECSGNLDGYAFNFFDRDGGRRRNFEPSDAGGGLVPDVQSGLRAFARYRGYDSDTFSQLADFNPDIPAGGGFTFAELKAEIDAGYPVVLYLQPFGVFSLPFPGFPRGNPNIHAMLAYGYVIGDDGSPYVRYRTSWASGDNQLSPWSDAPWTPDQSLNLPVRGVIGFRPHPKLTSIRPVSGGLQLRWHGPQAVLRDETADQETHVHRYVVEQTPDLTAPAWVAVASPTTDLETTLPDCCVGTRFFRVRLLDPSAP